MKFQSLIVDKFRVGKLLTQPEPLPFFSLTTLQPALKYDITLISTLKVKNILPSLFRLLQVTYLLRV